MEHKGRDPVQERSFTEKTIMTTEEMRNYFRIGNQTINDWRVKGLRAYRVNGRIFYFLEDVKAFMKLYEI